MKCVRESDRIKNEDHIVLFLDTKMMYLSQFENNFSNFTTDMFSNKDENPHFTRRFKAEHGSPFIKRMPLELI